jgi:hypothetical protein
MTKFLIPILAFAILTGCSKWDEASERAACVKSYPGDQAKADECYERNQLEYNKGLASIMRGAAR